MRRGRGGCAVIVGVALGAWALAGAGCGAATAPRDPGTRGVGGDAGAVGVDTAVAYAGAGSFAGSYTGTATIAIALTQPSAMNSSQNAPLAFDVTAAPAGAGVDMYLSFHDPGHPATACALGASRTGDAAVVPAGQTCTVVATPGQPDQVVFTARSGTATVTGTQLTVSLVLAANGMTGGMPVAGTYRVSFTGTRP